MSRILITEIKEKSIAEEAGIEKGDYLLNINDTDIIDVLDYDFLIKDEYLTVLIEKKDGSIEEIEVEKSFDEDLGLGFEEELIDKPRLCKNKCIFCFMDQIPDVMRSTLHYKDDDYRLSFIMGNYVTLTNASDEDLDRIIRYRMTPINISIHTTNGELRKKMLNNRFADKILTQLKKLTDGGISINGQIVLCPGINDGEELDRTLKDISKFYKNILSVSIVPVGTTRFRDGLYPLETFDSEGCKKVIEQVEKFQKECLKKYGTRLVFLGDEFYVQSNTPLPDYESYEDFSQIENGVGMVACFWHDFYEELDKLKIAKKNKTLTAITGRLIYSHMKQAANILESKVDGLKINIIPIKNNFFGEKITVTGLITGGDIIEQLSGVELGEELLIPKVMLKSDEDVFLDDITLEELSNKLNVNIRKIGCNGDEFVKDILK